MITKDTLETIEKLCSDAKAEGLGEDKIIYSIKKHLHHELITLRRQQKEEAVLNAIKEMKESKQPKKGSMVEAMTTAMANGLDVFHIEKLEGIIVSHSETIEMINFLQNCIDENDNKDTPMKKSWEAQLELYNKMLELKDKEGFYPQFHPALECAIEIHNFRQEQQKNAVNEKIIGEKITKTMV